MATIVRFRPTGWEPAVSVVESLTGSAAGASADSGVVSALSAPTITITNGATADIVEASTLQLGVSTTGSPAPTVSYSSSDELVATVDASGLVTAVGAAASSCTITATATNSEGSAQDLIVLTVQAAAGDAEPTYNAATSLFADDFESYANGAAILAGPWTGTNGNDAYIQTTDGRNGGVAGRITYGTGNGWNPALLLENQLPARSHIYVQFWFRVTAGTRMTGSGVKWFEVWRTTVETQPRWTCGVGMLTNMDGPEGFVNTGNEFSVHDNSWQLYATNLDGQAQTDWNPFVQNISKGGTFALLADGEWHRITYEIRLESRYGIRLWTDGVLRLSTFAGAPGLPSGGYQMNGSTVARLTWGDDQVDPPNQAWNYDIDDVLIWEP